MKCQKVVDAIKINRVYRMSEARIGGAVIWESGESKKLMKWIVKRKKNGK